MAIKRELQSVRFITRLGDPIVVDAPYAEGALLAFLSGAAVIDVGQATNRAYLMRDCICQVIEGERTEETVPGVPCDAVDCIEDYPRPTP